MLQLFFKADVKNMIEKGMTFKEIQEKMGFEDIGQGFGYKNYDVWDISACNDFYASDLIVYIPEYCYNDDTIIKQISVDNCYTREDFEKLCKNTSINADFLFDACDWQHPSSLLDEMLNDVEEEFENRKNNIQNWIYITEKNINNEFSEQGYEYLFVSDHKITNEELKNILFQACEIERIYNGEIHVRIQIEHLGLYCDSDECIFKVDMHLTNELTNFINWDKCPNLPPIYKIDRNNSVLEFVEDC